MGYPRSFLVDALVGGVYHCVSRCVRRESLIESLERCAWLVARLTALARILAIDVCDFAVMRNHVHLLVRTHPELAFAWSDEEVVRRWLSIALIGERTGNEVAEPAQADVDAALSDPALVSEWRVNSRPKLTHVRAPRSDPPRVRSRHPATPCRCQLAPKTDPPPSTEI